MLRRFLPFIVLIGAGALFYWVQTHKRGPERPKPEVHVVTNPVSDNPAENPTRDEPINRREKVIYSTHARCRMSCRHIDESEIKEILQNGSINYNKVESDGRGKTYPLEGVTHDQQHVRVVFAPKDDGLLVVTCIDLDRDWPCNCK
jgi:hypothetical protein